MRPPPFPEPPYPPVPKPPNPGTGSSNSGLSPGLITSTGGLFGTTGALLVPLRDIRTNVYYIGIWDPTNFNTEEDCYYYFRQENIKVNYAVSSYKAIIIYRNLGIVTVTFNITTFRKGLTTYNKNKATIQPGSYNTKSTTLVLGTSSADGKLYTLDVDIVNDGERPQFWFSRKANAGPLSIVSASIYGNADEKNKV